MRARICKIPKKLPLRRAKGTERASEHNSDVGDREGSGLWVRRRDNWKEDGSCDSDREEGLEESSKTKKPNRKYKAETTARLSLYMARATPWADPSSQRSSLTAKVMKHFSELKELFQKRPISQQIILMNIYETYNVDLLSKFLFNSSI
jgi:hypothetical protein